MNSGTEKLEKPLSFNAFTVALFVASRSGTNHTNFENASTQTKRLNSLPCCGETCQQHQ
jgi:hypothetical protein